VARAVAAARERGLPSVIVSFDPHPAAVLRPADAPLMLTTLERRITLLRSIGADDVVVLPFTRELSQQSPEGFAQAVLRDALHAEHVVVGANWRFGHKAAGDVALLRGLGFDVDGVELLRDAEVVSSSAIRTMLSAGDIMAAAAALDRPHLVEGPVVRGDARGRELGYPTANVAVDEGIVVPADGVYAGWLVRDRGEGSRAPGRGVRARCRPRSLRRAGGRGVRGQAARHGAVRLRGGPGRADGARCRGDPGGPVSLTRTCQGLRPKPALSGPDRSLRYAGRSSNPSAPAV
jgi:FAD synthase